MRIEGQEQLGTATSEGIRSQKRQQAPARFQNVAGIVLAGAHTWGECVLEQVFWRPLLPILSRPLIWHILDWLQHGGVPQAQICANSNTHTLRRALATRGPMGIRLEYYEDLMPRGPAGCVRDAATTLSADTFVVLDGTIFPCIDLVDLVEAHVRWNAVLTVVAHSQNHDKDCSKASLEPAGIYVMDRSALEGVPDMGYQDIKESLIPKLYKQGEHIAKYVVSADAIPHVRSSETYLATNMWAVQRILSKDSLPEAYVDINGAYVHESAEVDRSVRFVGPVLVGPGTMIEANAIIIGPTTIGQNCTVRRDSVINCSVIWDACEVDAAAVLDHCIVTDHSHVHPGIVLRKSICIPTRPSQPIKRKSLASKKTFVRGFAVNGMQSCTAANQPSQCSDSRRFDLKSEGLQLHPVLDND